MQLQQTRGGFYRPCIPKNAPENWGDWKFGNDGYLQYTGKRQVERRWRKKSFDELMDEFERMSDSEVESMFSGEPDLRDRDLD